MKIDSGLLLNKAVALTSFHFISFYYSKFERPFGRRGEMLLFFMALTINFNFLPGGDESITILRFDHEKNVHAVCWVTRMWSLV